MREPLSRRGLGCCLAFGILMGVSVLSAHAQAGPRKPKVPPGRDPGGVAVAILGAGVDYRRPDVAARLARDGEGEMIGWDVIDGDPFPLESAPAEGLATPVAAGTTAALSLLEAAKSARLIPVRVPAMNARALGGAMAFVSRTPARIVVILGDGGPSATWDPLRDGIARSPHALVVVPVTLLADAARSRLSELANVVSVAALDSSGAPLAPAAPAGATATIGLPVDASHPLVAEGDAKLTVHHLAAVALGGLAARLLAQAPGQDGAHLKARLLAVRRPPASAGDIVEGWIPKPDELPVRQ